MNLGLIILLIGIAGGLIILSILQIRMVVIRHFRSYKQEAIDYCGKHHLKILEIRSPNSKDWNDAPFKRPAEPPIRIVVFWVNNLPVTWSDQKFIFVLTESKSGRYQAVWMKISTEWFQPVKIEFAVRSAPKYRQKLYSNNTVTVNKKCPTCGTKLSESTNDCSGCGLVFQ